MSRDYKPAGKTGTSKSGAGSLLLGILIGLLLGLTIALAVAWYINKMPSPFVTNGAPADKGAAANPATPDATKPADTKPHFDFYKILPGSEEPITDQQLKESQQKGAAAAGKEAFFLQIGAFQNAAEADNRKAQLALLGVEATVQTVTSPDKGEWHRVRAGPYSDIGELNTVRDMLKQNGIETTLIRVREAPPDNPPEGK
ncbi:MAG TPA: SPOR domain-containing protein [Burkholderiales bacterium]|nr:SPOR domain-containing protein [Burkholderiales bacterium]